MNAALVTRLLARPAGEVLADAQYDHSGMFSHFCAMLERVNMVPREVLRKELAGEGTVRDALVRAGLQDVEAEVEAIRHAGEQDLGEKARVLEEQLAAVQAEMRAWQSFVEGGTGA